MIFKKVVALFRQKRTRRNNWSDILRVLGKLISALSLKWTGIDDPNLLRELLSR
jgi:hypothetical protein